LEWKAKLWQKPFLSIGVLGVLGMGSATGKLEPGIALLAKQSSGGWDVGITHGVTAKDRAISREKEWLTSASIGRGLNRLVGVFVEPYWIVRSKQRNRTQGIQLGLVRRLGANCQIDIATGWTLNGKRSYTLQGGLTMRQQFKPGKH
jgi:hypothetical protein